MRMTRIINNIGNPAVANALICLAFLVGDAAPRRAL
jgi:hypothetical protein